MSLTRESHDSLPYIDVEPSEAERANANKLITAHLPTDYAKTPHPDIPALLDLTLPSLFQKEVDRKAEGFKIDGGIDLSRYEAPDEPSGDADIDDWRAALRNAYISSSYLSSRHTNLLLLDEMGKNSWLVGNSQLEQILKDLERELAALKQQTESVNKARKSAQENSRGEIVGLEETWKQGVGKMIEVQVATDGLRQEVLERKKSGSR